MSWPLTIRGVGAVALSVAAFVGAYQLGVPGLLYVSVALMIFVVLCVASLYAFPRSDEVTRIFIPDVSTAGESAHVELQVHTRTLLPTIPGTWRDTLPVGVEGSATGTFPAISSSLTRAHATVTAEYRVSTQRRGTHPVGPLELHWGDPFGIAQRYRRVGGTDVLTVAPAILDLRALRELPGDMGGSQHTDTDRLGQGADNLIPRHYAPGDSMRRIHWRASAHRDHLMVRQEEQESTPEAVVVFDHSAHRFGADALTPGADDAFERAVSLCASAVGRLVFEGYQVTVIDAEGVELASPIDGGDHEGVAQFAIDLAPLVPRRDVPVDATVRLFSGVTVGPLVMITGRMDAADADAFAGLAHHSSLPLAFLTDDSGDAITRLERGGWWASPATADIADAWALALDRGVRADQ